MKLTIVDNVHLFKTLDGRYYSPAIIDDQFLSRYTIEFCDVQMVAKVKHITFEESKKFIPLMLEKIEIIEIPLYHGLIGLMKKLPLIIGQIRKIDDSRLILLRISQVESMLVWILKRKNPYFVEIVNDPDLFLDGVKRLVAIFFMIRIIRKSIGVSTITTNYFDIKYPILKRVPVRNAYSTIDLYPEDYYYCRTIKDKKNKGITILHVSNIIADNSKGHIEFLKITKLLVEKGFNIKAIIIGEGRFVSQLKKIANEMRILVNVDFKGRIPSKIELFKYYKSSDFLVFPTKSDLQGRVIIEAMANSLPVVSSFIGGIPEIVHNSCLFDIRDYSRMTNKIVELIFDSRELKKIVDVNYKKSLDFMEIKNSQKRQNYYREVKSFFTNR